jgi:hypothetical protein
VPWVEDAVLKTAAAFRRQLDLLCTVTRQELPHAGQLQALRESIRRARNETGVSSGFSEDEMVQRCAERFFRVLAAADHELSLEEIVQLEHYVEGCLVLPDEPAEVVRADAHP